MDRETRDSSRSSAVARAGPIENNLIDELVDGELDRQEFLRRAAVFGLGAGTIGMLLRYVGEADLAFGAPAATAQRRGGTLRVGTVAYNEASSRTGYRRPDRSASQAFPASTSRSRTASSR